MIKTTERGRKRFPKLGIIYGSAGATQVNAFKYSYGHCPIASDEISKKELTQWNINSFIITGISKRGWTTWLSAIADPDVEAIVPFAIDLLDIDASLEHIINHTVEIGPLHSTPTTSKA